MEIKSFNIASLHQAEDFSFHALAIAEFEKCTEELFLAVFNVYKEKFSAFDANLKTAGGKDPETKEVKEADEATDSCYSGLAATTRAMVGHYDPAIAELARRVDIILRKYGNPTNLSYLEEYGIIDNLLQDLAVFDTTVITTEDASEEDENIPDELADDVHNLDTLGLTGWVNQLKKCRDRFMTAYSKRNATQAVSVSGATKAARKETDAAYRNTVKRMNALIELNGEAVYVEIINNINQLIDNQKTVIASRTTRNANKNSEDIDFTH